MAITRRQLGFISAGALGSSLTRSLWAREAFSTFPVAASAYADSQSTQVSSGEEVPLQMRYQKLVDCSGTSKMTLRIHSIAIATTRYDPTTLTC